MKNSVNFINCTGIGGKAKSRGKPYRMLLKRGYCNNLLKPLVYHSLLYVLIWNQSKIEMIAMFILKPITYYVLTLLF